MSKTSHKAEGKEVTHTPTPESTDESALKPLLILLVPLLVALAYGIWG